jgi:hypothetical protein
MSTRLNVQIYHVWGIKNYIGVDGVMICCFGDTVYILIINECTLNT